MAKVKIYNLFAIALVLIPSRRRKRKTKLRSSRQRFWIWPLLADRATSGASTN